jgi:hypothetical protein
MKKLFLILMLCATAMVAFAEGPADGVTEKRYAIREYNAEIYCLDSTNGDLWWFDYEAMTWGFLGSPRGATTHSKGTYTFIFTGETGILIVDTKQGETWWTDGETWVSIKEPSTRFKRY